MSQNYELIYEWRIEDSINAQAWFTICENSYPYLHNSIYELARRSETRKNKQEEELDFLTKEFTVCKWPRRKIAVTK